MHLVRDAFDYMMDEIVKTCGNFCARHFPSFYDWVFFQIDTNPYSGELMVCFLKSFKGSMDQSTIDKEIERLVGELPSDDRISYELIEASSIGYDCTITVKFEGKGYDMYEWSKEVAKT